jgi:hypothetical protein
LSVQVEFVEIKMEPGPRHDAKAGVPGVEAGKALGFARLAIAGYQLQIFACGRT